MARNFVSASSQYLEYSAAVLTAAPLTITCWYMPTTLVSARVISLVNSGAIVANGFSLEVLNTGAVRARTGDGAATSTADTTTVMAAGTWHHIAAVFGSATDRNALLDGAGKTNNATSRTPSGINDTVIGANRSSTGVAAFANGVIDHPSVWNDSLSDGELLQLARGAEPLSVRPQSLLAYYSLTEPGVSQEYNGVPWRARQADMLVVGPTPISGCPIGGGKRRRSLFGVSAAGGGRLLAGRLLASGLIGGAA